MFQIYNIPFSLIAYYTHLPISVQSFFSSSVIILLSTNYLFMLSIHYQISLLLLLFFNALFLPFNIYVIIKCLISYSEVELQFSASVCQSSQSFVYICLFVFGRRSPFNISCSASLVVVNSLRFHLSEKAFISSSSLNDSFAGYSILD